MQEQDQVRPSHRPEKNVDWKRVDELLEAGCLGTEIAAHFDMHPNSFYAKVQAKHKCGFTQYSLERKQKGDSLLREAQYKKALKSDNTMLIWLGKNRLGQKETHEVVAATNDVTVDHMLSTIKEVGLILDILTPEQKEQLYKLKNAQPKTDSVI